jgi:small redox-active disulfide protein 2
MKIKILGSGCPKCQRLEKLTLEVVHEHGLQVELEHVREPAKIMDYTEHGTPSLEVDGEVKASGHLPSKEEIARLLGIA